VNTTSANRINKYLKDTSGTVQLGGESDGCYIAPTVITDVKADDATMQDEIFGPVLSIVPIDNLDQAIEFINSR
jgi:acyl-CoA reductase-like NAD-dependent aldehyde dehydrogenase